MEEEEVECWFLLPESVKCMISSEWFRITRSLQPFFLFSVHGVIIALDGMRQAGTGDFPVAEFNCNMGWFSMVLVMRNL